MNTVLNGYFTGTHVKSTQHGFGVIVDSPTGKQSDVCVYFKNTNKTVIFNEQEAKTLLTIALIGKAKSNHDLRG